MPATESQILRSSALLPQPNPDTQPQELRGDNYGSPIVLPAGGMRHALAAEGSYEVFTTPNPSTAVAYGSGGTQASYSATTGFVVIKNNAPSGMVGAMLHMDYLRIIMAGTAPASATSLEAAVHIDSGNRAPSLNATLLSPVNINFRSQRGVVGQVWVPSAGIPTVPAAVNARQIDRICLLPAIPVIRSTFELRFGAQETSPAIGVQTVGNYATFCAPLVLGPQEFGIVTLWLPSGATNPFSCELSGGWWVK